MIGRPIATTALWLGVLAASLFHDTSGFVAQRTTTTSTTALFSSSSITDDKSQAIQAQKEKLLQLLGPKKYQDPVLADPLTKEPVTITSSTRPVLGSSGRSPTVNYQLQSPTSTFRGSSDTYLDLLEPFVEESSKSDDSSASPLTALLQQGMAFIPPQLRGSLSNVDSNYIPMRDLFTSPAVSFAYERGWRQNFAAAGFPGPDAEAKMAMEYFAPVVALTDQSTVVDMSCATGLFTRRFALSEKYGRVLGCDYSPSMLAEARRRIDSDPKLSSSKSLDLVRLDVGQIPMQVRPCIVGRIWMPPRRKSTAS